MNCTKLKAKRKFIISRGFEKSRLEAEYLVKSYELVVPIYGIDCLQQKDLHINGLEKAKHRERIGA